ncbi:phosphoserine phosphatase SerB [Calidifontibacter terrae]
MSRLPALQNALREGPGLLVMDVDSTLIQQEVIELLAAHAGREAEVAGVTEAAMRGELDFADSLRRRVEALAGLPVSVFDDVRAAVRFSAGAQNLVTQLHARGWVVGVVSGGFLEIVGPLAQELGIDHAHANVLEVRDGLLTGRLAAAVVDRAEKANRLRSWAAEHQIPIDRTVAVGDGANDLDMFAAAAAGIAFNAKPVLREQADAVIEGPRLDEVLDLLGLSAPPSLESDHA